MNIVVCNCPPDAAEKIARALVERRLAACVNLIAGVRSFYRWEGELCDDAETTLLIKVTPEGVESLREAIVELHPYSVPEVVVLPVNADQSHQPYVDWVRAEVGPFQPAQSAS